MEKISVLDRPLIRWAGSKRSQLHALHSLVPTSFDRYVEPFCGSAALFYKLRPNKAFLSDINKNLIGFYQACKTDPRRVFQIAAGIPREKDTYIRIRRKFNEAQDCVRAAGYFYYLNQNCFNGLYRTNKDGDFNVPFSGSKTGERLSFQQFSDLCALLSKAEFRACDFEATIQANLKRNSFFFIDPPYAVTYRRPFTEYYKQAFAPDDLDRLIGCLEQIENANGYFLLTYDASLARIFKRRDWHHTHLTVRRNISGFASHRKTAKEVAISNYRQTC